MDSKYIKADTVLPYWSALDGRLSKSIKRGMVNDQTYSSTYIGFVKDPITINLFRRLRDIN